MTTAKMSTTFCLLLGVAAAVFSPSTAAAASADEPPDLHAQWRARHPEVAPWTSNEALRAAASDVVTSVPAPRFTLNLDDPPQERWSAIAAVYKSEAYKITDYLKSQLPSWAFPILIEIAANLEPYFTDYGDEMIGLAEGLGLDLGDIVATNLVYQLERIGVNCSNWNNTGPTSGGDDAIPRGLGCDEALTAWDEERLSRALPTGPAGRCTSIVAQDAAGFVAHGRNLDWNIPDALKDFVVDVDFYRGGQLIYTGTTAVGFVGMLNGMRHGSSSSSSSGGGGGSSRSRSRSTNGETAGEAWSVSMDARNHGGRIPLNLAQALKTHALTPEQALRKALESDAWGAGGFEQAVDALSTVQLVDDVYYVMAGGGGSNQLAVVTRARNAAVDVWRLDPPHGENPPWWLVETNYDHWKAVPKADDRRDPANEYMAALGSTEGTTLDTMLRDVMSEWPVFNPHTTFTTMINPYTGAYNSTVWYGNAAAAAAVVTKQG
jgi:N-acylethanolamine-hydrolysing acid amidase